MIKKRLTLEQVDDLLAICQNYEVNYYDVQIELVDHMACQIEAIWETNPTLPFDEALNSVLIDFGMVPLYQTSYDSLLPLPDGYTPGDFYDFNKVVRSKEKELAKKYDRLQWRYIVEFYKLPKVILTAVITVVIFAGFHVLSNDFILSISLLVLFIIGLLIHIKQHSEEIRLKITTNKKFLILEHHRTVKWRLFQICLAPLVFGGSLNMLPKVYNGWGQFQWVGELLTALAISFFMIFSFANAIYLPRRIKEDFTREFPQFVTN